MSDLPGCPMLPRATQLEVTRTTNSRSPLTRSLLWAVIAALFVVGGCGRDSIGEGQHRPDWARSACGEPGAPALRGSRVVRYPVTHHFSESECELIKGVKSGSRCSFPDKGLARLDDGSGQTLGRAEMAFDPDTCEALFETGILAEDPMYPPTGHSDAKQGEPPRDASRVATRS